MFCKTTHDRGVMKLFCQQKNLPRINKINNIVPKEKFHSFSKPTSTYKIIF